MGRPPPPEGASVGYALKPRALAVLRLMTNSNFVGCSTGRSAGLAPFENLVHVRRGPSEQIAEVWSAGHQAPGDYDKLALVVNRRQPVLGREFNNAGSIRTKQGRGDHYNFLPLPFSR